MGARSPENAESVTNYRPLSLHPSVTIAMTEAIDTNVPAATSPLSPDEKKRLEKAIESRPDQRELVDRNILKDTTVAPSLQAARDRLQRSQLEDKLEGDLQLRPKPEELVKRGILNEDEAPPSS